MVYKHGKWSHDIIGGQKIPGDNDGSVLPPGLWSLSGHSMTLSLSL